MLKYPNINPEIFRIGPIAPRWYGLMYVLGFIFAYWRLRRNWRYVGLANQEEADAVMGSVIIGLILGARIAYVVFYNWDDTMQGPWWEVFAVWHGGLAFHGGFVGTIVGLWVAAKKRKLQWMRFCDVMAISAPLGLAFGRIANFINGELFGRVSNVPWAMVFPRGGPLPRHPSQIYESLMEGFLLFTIVNIVWLRKPRVGLVSSLFVFFYALFRIIGELFREPDIQVGYLFLGITMGQLLSAFMLLFGVGLIYYTAKYGASHDTPAPNYAVLSAASKKKKK